MYYVKCNIILNRMKRRNPPCTAPPLSSFPMGKKLDTTQRGASQGGFLLFILFITHWQTKILLYNSPENIVHPPDDGFISSDNGFKQTSSNLIVSGFPVSFWAAACKCVILSCNCINSGQYFESRMGSNKTSLPFISWCIKSSKDVSRLRSG